MTAARPVFVYGSLTDADRVDALLGDWRFAGEATLVGLRPVAGRHPTLVPGGETAGRLLVTSELDALDRYEGVDRGLYVRVGVPVVDGGSAWVYVGDPGRLGAAGDWPGEGPFVDRVRDHVGSATVRVRRAADR
ncbi:MAG: gamma-glutamylcyclotransferase family protein [Halobacteriales archaeon]|nr:gamma-glutamylcyclotransferase family protein [Halobacteriales archaeon]